MTKKVCTKCTGFLCENLCCIDSARDDNCAPSALLCKRETKSSAPSHFVLSDVFFVSNSFKKQYRYLKQERNNE